MNLREQCMIKQSVTKFIHWFQQMNTPWYLCGVNQQLFLIQEMLEIFKCLFANNFKQQYSCIFVSGFWFILVSAYILKCGLSWNIIELNDITFFTFIDHFAKNNNISLLNNQLKRYITKYFNEKTLPVYSII